MKNERGAFLIIFCIVLTVLLLSSLAVIDISNQRSETDHARHFTKLAALEGLKAYQESRDKNGDPSGTGNVDANEKKWEVVAAKAATRYLESVDINHQVFKAGIKNKKSGNGHEEILAKSSSTDLDNDMVLELGYWVNCKNQIEQALDICKDKSGSGVDESNQGFLAAKEYRDTIRVGYGNSNAVRISGKWLQDSKTYTIGRLLSGSSNRLAPKVSATAMIIPRHIYFLVDITDSGDDDTFTNPEIGYVLCRHDASDNENIDTCYRGDDDLPTDMGSTRKNHDTKTMYASDFVRKMTFGDDDYAGLSSEDQAIHPSPDDYEKRYSFNTVTGSPGGWGSDKSRNAFYVHAYNNPEVENDGRPLPEPLTTIITGVNDALNLMKKRRVTGDKAGLIFFSNGLVWPRVTKLTDDFDALMKLTDYLGTPNADLDRIMEDDPAGISGSAMSLVDNASNGLERAIRFSILPIPGFLSPTGGNEVDSWTYTNIAEAVAAAMEFINEDEYVSDNESLDPNIYRSMVLFSDGMPNCYFYEAEGRYICYNGLPTDPQAPATFYPYWKAASFFNKGINKLNEVVFAAESNTLKQKGIPFNVFHVGSNVGPHTLMIKKADGSCYTDAEYRKTQEIQSQFPYFVKGGGGYYTRSARSPYYTAAEYMYTLARQTKGLYVPLRSLDSKQCAKTKTCVQNKNCDYSCLPDKKSGTRITTDPYCRTLNEQVTDGIEEILAVNPYRLVDVK